MIFWKKPAEGACASSSISLYNAVFAVESGRFKRVLVIGVEKMNLLSTPDVTHVLACSSFWPDEGANGMTFPGLFVELAKGYMALHKYSLEQMQEMFAHVSALSYGNGFDSNLCTLARGVLPTIKYSNSLPISIRICFAFYKKFF